MDVIFAAINKFLLFLSGFSNTHRFCYQLVNLCVRHCGIRFPWMKCWPNQRENNVAEKLVFPSSVFPSTPSRIFSFCFSSEFPTMMSTWREGKADSVAGVHFFVIAERISAGIWKSQKCRKSPGIIAVFSSSSGTSAQLNQPMCQKKKKT